jgi:hypothetical protein
MRCAIIMALVLLVLPGCSVSQQAVAPSSPTAADLTALTMEEAIAKLGLPTFERRCQDGGTVLAWKISGAQVTPRERPTAPYAQVVDTPCFRAVVARSAGVGEQRATLVVKFDSSGRMLWGRQVR